MIEWHLPKSSNLSCAIIFIKSNYRVNLIENAFTTVVTVPSILFQGLRTINIGHLSRRVEVVVDTNLLVTVKSLKNEKIAFM